MTCCEAFLSNSEIYVIKDWKCTLVAEFKILRGTMNQLVVFKHTNFFQIFQKRTSFNNIQGVVEDLLQNLISNPPISGVRWMDNALAQSSFQSRMTLEGSKKRPCAYGKCLFYDWSVCFVFLFFMAIIFLPCSMVDGFALSKSLHRFLCAARKDHYRKSSLCKNKVTVRVTINVQKQFTLFIKCDSS